LDVRVDRFVDAKDLIEIRSIAQGPVQSSECMHVCVCVCVCVCVFVCVCVVVDFRVCALWVADRAEEWWDEMEGFSIPCMPRSSPSHCLVGYGNLHLQSKQPKTQPAHRTPPKSDDINHLLGQRLA
jgi:hypothetical protein